MLMIPSMFRRIALAWALAGAVAVIAAAAGSSGALASTERIALVIGNNAYAEAPLKNPINDARTMGATLRDLGFDVRVLENADRITIQRAVVDFGRKLRNGSVGLFYYAGHGMQVRGANYLIPVKANIESEDEVEVEAVDVAYVLARMATARNPFNIVILDACRNNPFQRAFRSVSNGLAAITAPTGTLIAYATAPGSVASDGDGANGIYTGELIAAMRQPGLSMEEAFKLARSRVIARTQGKQTPWESSSVIGEFSFRPQVASAAPSSAPAAAMPASDTAVELAFWNSIKDSRDPRDFQAYIESYPDGAFTRLARIRISSMPDPAASNRAPASNPQATRPQAPAPRVTADPPQAVASAAPAAAPKSTQPVAPGVVMGEDFEKSIKANWRNVELALRSHIKANEEAYLSILPSVSRMDNLRVFKMTLLDVIDSQTGSVNIMLEGSREGATGTFRNIIGFTAVIGYKLRFEDGKVLVDEYRYISKT